MAEMVLSHSSERSVLGSPNVHELEPYVVAGRKRLATCSGVSWFRGYHLAVVNLYGKHLRVYRFQPGADSRTAPARLELLHEVTEGLSYPEDVAVSPDGNLLAIAHSMSEEFGVSLHPIDTPSLAPGLPGHMMRQGSGFHSLRFSPDSRHLALTEVGETGYVEVVDVTSGDRVCLLENRRRPLKLKSVAFSGDGRFAVIAWALSVTKRDLAIASHGVLAVHPFDSRTGTIDEEPLVECHGAGISLGNVDMCTFLPVSSDGRYRILVANQGFDV